MMHPVGLLFGVILLVFYLYLGVRWQYVKRPWCYMFGAAGLGLIIVAQFFVVGTINPGSGWATTMRVISVLGLLVAFKGAIGAVYGAKIPVWDTLVPPKGAEEKPAEQEQPPAM